MSLPNHGANPQFVYMSLGIEQPIKVLDFSENVNPMGPPATVTENWNLLQSFMNLYPDPLAEPFLTTVAQFHQVSTDSVFIGNGAAEVFSLLAERYRGKRAILVHPTFSEYASTLNARNVEMIYLSLVDIVSGELPIDEMKHHMADADVLYLCTPNNPTGTLPNRKLIMEIVEHARHNDCEVVLDEAFIDFVSEEASFISNSDSNHVIVVRSMTKMYAMPGLRLGYMVAAPTIVQEVRQLAPHWNVNGIAAKVGALVLEDENYRLRTIQHCNKMRSDMSLFLKSNDCQVTHSQVNFLLFKLPKPHKEFFRRLLGKGIVLRHTENFHGLNGEWFRIGMKTEEEMGILKRELTEWFEAH